MSQAEFSPHFRSIPVTGEMPDAVAFYASLRTRFPETGGFLFSRNRSERDTFVPQMDIIGIRPTETMRARDGEIRHVLASGETHVSREDPFTAVARRLAEKRGVPHPELPDFQGGAFGYFGFDAVRTLERVLRPDPLTNQSRRQTRTAADFDAEFLFFSQCVILDHDRRRVLLIQCRDGSSSETEGSAKAGIAELFAAYQNFLANPLPMPRVDREFAGGELSTEAMSAMLGKAGHAAGVAQLKAKIAEGEIFQAVLSERFEMPFTGDPIALLRTLSRLSPSPYRYFFQSEDRVYLGCSPEMLLKVKGEALETHPIAGTRPRGRTVAEDVQLERQLTRSTKEQAEHLMLVDLARNDLSRVSVAGSVKLGAFRQVRKFGGVMHLVSTVHGLRRPGVSAVEALAACFPAGTLSGAPKIRAIQLITELEPAARGFYGGAVTLASFTGDLDSCIAIRSLAIAEGRVRVQAGGGIVADSKRGPEYAEIQHKSRLVRRALAEQGLRVSP